MKETERNARHSLESWRARRSVSKDYWSHAGWCSHLGLWETRNFVMDVEDQIFVIPRIKQCAI